MKQINKSITMHEEIHETLNKKVDLLKNSSMYNSLAES
jgi:predicted nucleotidyltransferase